MHDADTLKEKKNQQLAKIDSKYPDVATNIQGIIFFTRETI